MWEHVDSTWEQQKRRRVNDCEYYEPLFLFLSAVTSGILFCAGQHSLPPIETVAAHSHNLWLPVELEETADQLDAGPLHGRSSESSLQRYLFFSNEYVSLSVQSVSSNITGFSPVHTGTAAFPRLFRRTRNYLIKLHLILKQNTTAGHNNQLKLTDGLVFSPLQPVRMGNLETLGVVEVATETREGTGESWLRND